jgi:tRNA (cmo5U34)-methyltransferase
MTKTKSSVEQIRARFDADVERFSNLETGVTAQVDSALCLDLIASSAAATNPQAKAVLDVGCGAGNYTVKLLGYLPGLDCTLLDLSLPMLDRARQRVTALTTGQVQTVQGDVREVDLGAEQFDLILASTVLHHLRADAEWEQVYSKLYRALRPGGMLYIYDMIIHDLPAINTGMWTRFGAYLSNLKGEAYRDHVLGYIDDEDTPRSLGYQMGVALKAGFSTVEVLHKHFNFAAYVAVK